MPVLVGVAVFGVPVAVAVTVPVAYVGGVTCGGGSDPETASARGTPSGVMLGLAYAAPGRRRSRSLPG